MTRQEILMEIQEFGNPNAYGYDINQFIIIGKAADVINHNVGDDELKDIEVWINPRYYDVLMMEPELIETTYEDGKPTHYIQFAYTHLERLNGSVKLYRGDVIGPKPKFRKIKGCNVQVPIQDAAAARILNFHGNEKPGMKDIPRHMI